MQQNSEQLNAGSIVAAFQVMAMPNHSKQAVKEADEFLAKCQHNPNFVLALMSIFTDLADVQLKYQVLLHLKNVIMRNWMSARRSNNGYMTEQVKGQVKSNLLAMYQANWAQYYKLFNQIFKFVSRKDYPSNYPQLHSFIKQVLVTLAGFSIDQILTSQELLPYLSLVKTVLKEFKQKSVGLNGDVYHEYIAELVHLAASIQERIQEALDILKSEPGKVQNSVATKLLECSRKVDKIILYGLMSFPVARQAEEGLAKILLFQLNKLQFLLTFSSEQLEEEIELNILAILEGIFVLQSKFPFAFTGFLSQYLETIIHMLFSFQFQNERLTSCVVQANTKPLLTFAFYMDEAEFQGCLYARKSNQSFDNQHRQCHEIFMRQYGGQNAPAYLEKILTQLMPKHPRSNEEDELIFEDAETKQESNGDQTVFDFLLILVRNIVIRFKEEMKPTVQKILGHLLSSTSGSAAETGMYEIVMMLPSVYNREEIDFQQIFGLMEKSFASGNYAMFSRLIRYYHDSFEPDLLAKSFHILTQITTKQDLDHFMLYQSAVCIRKLLSDHEDSSLPLDNMGPCFASVFKLLMIYRSNPNHLWNLLRLLSDLLKTLSAEAVVSSLPFVVEPISAIIEMPDNSGLTISAIAELLQKLLAALNPDDAQQIAPSSSITQLAFKLLFAHIDNSELEDTDSLHRLWVTAMKSHRPEAFAPDFNQRLVAFFQERSHEVKEEDPALYCELIEEYMMSNLLQLAPNDVLSLFSSLIADPADPQPKICMALYSLYFTYSLTTNSYIEAVVVGGMQIVSHLINKISVAVNTLRTQILLVLSHHIIVFSPATIFGLFNSAWTNYEGWFSPFLWTLSYLNQKYVNKVVGMALLESFSLLQERILGTLIDGQLPFDDVVKCIASELEPIPPAQAMNRYALSLKMNFHPEAERSRPQFSNSGGSLSRKIRLHVNESWASYNLQGVLREKLVVLMSAWDWGMDDIGERFENSLVDKIGRILGRQA